MAAQCNRTAPTVRGGKGFQRGVNHFLNLMADENVRFNERNQLRLQGKKCCFQYLGSGLDFCRWASHPAAVETQPQRISFLERRQHGSR